MNYALEHDIINMSYVQEQIKLVERKEILENKHPYKIWQGKDGYWYTHLPDAKKGRKLKKRSKREKLEDDIVTYWKTHDTMPLKDAFQEWVDMKLRYGDIKPQTHARYEWDFNRFFKGSELEYEDVRSITENDLEDFIRKTIHDRGLTRKAYNGLRTIIRGTFKYAKKKGMTDISISQFFGDIDLSRRIFKSVYIPRDGNEFTSNEQKMIEDYVWDNPDLLNLGILLVFYTGLRSGELSALKPADINGDILHVCRTEVNYKIETGKYYNGVQECAKTDAGNRSVILTAKAKEVVRRIRLQNPFGEYLFMRDGERIKERSFGHRLHVICDQLGIPRRSMHKIRRTCATNMINRGVDESLIISQLGHTTIDCTKHYYYYDNTTLEEAKSQLERAAL